MKSIRNANHVPVFVGQAIAVALWCACASDVFAASCQSTIDKLPYCVEKSEIPKECETADPKLSYTFIGYRVRNTCLSDFDRVKYNCIRFSTISPVKEGQWLLKTNLPTSPKAFIYVSHFPISTYVDAGGACG